MTNPLPGEQYHGIDFLDWSAANAHLSFGDSLESVVATLGLEMPLWEEANAKWLDRFTEAMTADMAVATVYGEVFQQPQVGKFAKPDSSSEPADAKPGGPPKGVSFKRFAELSAHIAVASEQAIDMQTVLSERYNLSVGDYSQLQMYYMQPPVAPAGGRELQDYFAQLEALKAVARTRFEQEYGGGAGSGLADDITF